MLCICYWCVSADEWYDMQMPWDGCSGWTFIDCISDSWLRPTGLSSRSHCQLFQSRSAEQQDASFSDYSFVLSKKTQVNLYWLNVQKLKFHHWIQNEVLGNAKWFIRWPLWVTKVQLILANNFVSFWLIKKILYCECETQHKIGNKVIIKDPATP